MFSCSSILLWSSQSDLCREPRSTLNFKHTTNAKTSLGAHKKTQNSWLTPVVVAAMVHVYCVNLLSAYPKISQTSSILVPILSQFWGLGPTWADLGPPWDLNDEDVHSKPPFLRILSPKGDPIRDPKINLGASRWPSELPRTSFGGDFLRTYFLHENRPPKLTQKVIFFGPLDVAKTW